jgi:glycine dehydrogenase subunit 2
MYRSARYTEPLLNELQGGPSPRFTPLKELPSALQRHKPLHIPNLDETQIVRHFLHLSQMNYGIESGVYPLGSCTMKYNPKLSDYIAEWDQFTHTHPYQDETTIQGNLQILYELEQMLSTLTGMSDFTLQPAAGAHGEFLGMLLTHAYHEHQQDTNRTEIILPDTSHGTNPASAAMAGYKVIEIPSTKDGTVDLSILDKILTDHTACFMLTNPNTLGIFETDILEIAKMVHQSGALLYYDGANMNAIMGKARPGDMGFDIVHLNLHKTFSTPHGGGGPGSGPIGVKPKLAPFLPTPRIVKQNDHYYLDYNHPYSIGKIKEFYGNFSVLLKAYIYIQLMGSDGLQEVTEIAVLNANYMKERILETQDYHLPFKHLRKHEFVISCEQLLNQKNIRAMDVAKRLLDYGLHPPTVYFPLIVKEALMIEPTESETKKTLDAYVEAMSNIATEDPDIVKNAPQHTSVKRIDEAGAIKNPILNWQMLSDDTQ